MISNFAWAIINDDHQPLFTDGYWIFSTKKRAEEFLAGREHSRPREIIKMEWVKTKDKKLALIEFKKRG